MKIFTSVTRLLVGVICLFMASAVAYADHPSWEEGFGSKAHPGPVGSKLLNPAAPGNTNPPSPSSFNGALNGFGYLGELGDGIPGGNPLNPANIAITNNPNCPLHWLP